MLKERKHAPRAINLSNSLENDRTVSYVSQMYTSQLILNDVHCANISSHDVNQKLQCLIVGLVGKDSSVKNIELAVTKADGSYSWAGAAGIANQQGQIPMTTETPNYIASVIKIYIATTIMKLAEEKAFSLDDPMAKYLPADLIKGIDVYHGKDYSQQVTIRELASMTSGIADYYEEKGTDGKSMFDLFVQNPEKTWTVDEMIQRARAGSYRASGGELGLFLHRSVTASGRVAPVLAGAGECGSVPILVGRADRTHSSLAWDASEYHLSRGWSPEHRCSWLC